MRISRLELRNWKNFRNVEISDLPEVVYVIGPNASGKSNLLDALTFLGDATRPEGGGLRQAVRKRGGMGQVRCLHAKSEADVKIEVDLSDENDNLLWTYSLTFRSWEESDEPVVLQESATRHYKTAPSKTLLKKTLKKGNRVSDNFFMADIERLGSDKTLKNLAGFLSQIRHFYIIPQFIKINDQISGELMDGDPFGRGFISWMNSEEAKIKASRIRKIEKSLKSAMPQLENLNLVSDKLTGKPHLEVKLKNQRCHGAVQREDQISDGTIRLVAMLWICYGISGHSVIIEEPELSLSDGVIKDLSWFFEKSLRESEEEGQIFVSTHNASLLSNTGIDPDGVIVVKPSNEASKAEKMNQYELRVIEAGLSPSDAALESVERAARMDLGL